MGIFTGLFGDATLAQAAALTGEVLGTTDSWWGEAGVRALFPMLPPNHRSLRPT